LLSARAGLSFNPVSNQVTVAFDKRIVKNASSTALTNYAITVLGTSNRLALTNIVVGASQVRLSARDNFLFGTNYLLIVNNVTGTNGLPIAPNSMIGITMALTNPPFTNTSPLPPKLAIVRQSPAAEVISWGMDTGGLHWDLESSTDPASNNWTTLPDSSPYTNSAPGQKFFRAKVR